MPNGGLSTTAPTPATITSASLRLQPERPGAPRFGGNYTYLQSGGTAGRAAAVDAQGCHPFRQRPPHRSRSRSPARSAPRSTFRPVTRPTPSFVVKFTDVQPDGYEMIVRESATHRRASRRSSTARPRRSSKGQGLPARSRSLEHRHGASPRGIALASSSPAAARTLFRSHPNSFDPVASLAGAPVAHQQVYFTKQYPSCITLPVVPFDCAVNQRRRLLRRNRRPQP